MEYVLKTAGETRIFWVQSSGGYVREIDNEHPGTLGRQVSDCLGYTGDMLRATPATLAAVIRAARRRELRRLRRAG